VAKIPADGGVRRLPSYGRRFYTLYRDGSITVRAAPKRRRKKIHPYQQQTMDFFRNALAALKRMTPEEQIWAREMTKGTTLLPRDLLLNCI
jgi:hypothetical protein